MPIMDDIELMILTRVMITAIGLAIYGVCLLVIIGLIINNYSLTSWGGEIGMAIPTAACFMLSGTGC